MIQVTLIQYIVLRNKMKYELRYRVEQNDPAKFEERSSYRADRLSLGRIEVMRKNSDMQEFFARPCIFDYFIKIMYALCTMVG